MAVAHAVGVDPASLIDLSASLNPFAPDVSDLAAQHLGALVPYPDDDHATHRLANAIGVDPELLVLTNGGAEAIALVAGILATGSVVEPEFSLYRRHLLTIDDDAGRWRSNPANPIGTLAPSDATAAVWDEAFYPLATGCWTRGDHDAWRLGSLTKLWSCAGLRLGYVIAPDARRAELVRARRPQWSVNGLALALVDDLVERSDLPGWATSIRGLRRDITVSLRSLGFDVTESEANWILVNDDADLRERLVPHGVVVRDCTSFGLPGTYRVALPRPEQLDRVVTAFDRCR